MGSEINVKDIVLVSVESVIGRIDNFDSRKENYIESARDGKKHE